MKNLKSSFKLWFLLFLVFPVWGGTELQIIKEPVEINNPSLYRLSVEGGGVLCEHEGGNPNIEYSYDSTLDTKKLKIYLCSWKTLHRAEGTNGVSYEIVGIDLVSKKKIEFKKTPECNHITSGFEGSDQGKNYSFLYKAPSSSTKEQISSCLQKIVSKNSSLESNISVGFSDYFDLDNNSLELKKIVSEATKLTLENINIYDIEDTNSFIIDIDNASIYKSYTVVTPQKNTTVVTEFKYNPLGAFSYSILYRLEKQNALKHFFKNYKDIQSINDIRDSVSFFHDKKVLLLKKKNRIPKQNIYLNKQNYLSNNKNFITPVFSKKFSLLGFYISQNKIRETDIMSQNFTKLLRRRFLKLKDIKGTKELIKAEKSKILFDTTQYQIRCKTPNCHQIRIIDKVKGTKKSLKDEVSEEMFKLSTSEKDDSFKFYDVSIDTFKKGRYLRLDYSIIGFVNIVGEGREEKHVLENCTIIDLQTAQVKEVASARDETCYIDDYLSTVSFTVFKQVPVYIGIKTYLYKFPNKKTKMYLIKGDKVTFLDEKTDESGQKWYFINYKGKKELNMWIKAEAVDLEPQAEKIESKPIEKPKAKKPEPVNKTPTNKPAEIAQVTLTTTPKNTVIIKAEKVEPINVTSSNSYPEDPARNRSSIYDIN